MLLTLCRYQKATALLFYFIFYGELLISSSQVRAASFTGYCNRIEYKGSSIIQNFGNPHSFSNPPAPEKSKPDLKSNKDKKQFSLVKNNKNFEGPGPTQPEMQSFTS